MGHRRAASSALRGAGAGSLLDVEPTVAARSDQEAQEGSRDSRARPGWHWVSPAPALHLLVWNKANGCSVRLWVLDLCGLESSSVLPGKSTLLLPLIIQA